MTASIGFANINRPSHITDLPTELIAFPIRPNADENFSPITPALIRTTAIGPNTDASASETTPAAVATIAKPAASLNSAEVNCGCRLTKPSRREASSPNQSASFFNAGATVSPILAIALVKEPVAASHLLPRVFKEASTRSRREA